TSEASEFELGGIPAGVYRVRAMNSFGRVSFARGLVVPPSDVGELKAQFGGPIELEKRFSREVMGVVRWENGHAGEESVVILQDATNFRRLLKRVVADKNGFFSIPDVPAGRYVAFALPPKEEQAMKQFVYPVVAKEPRETWLDFTLSPHRVVGRVPAVGSSESVDLILLGPKGEEAIVWTVVPTEEGKFEIANVPHGRYLVRARGGAAGHSSHPFVVESDLVVTVRWPK